MAGLVPRQRLGYAMGVLQVGMAGGIAFGPLLGGFLADAFGYQMAFVSTGLLLFVAGVLVSVGVEEKSLGPAPTAGKSSAGLMADWRTILAAPGVGLTYSLNFLTGLGRMMFVPILPLFVLSLLPEGASINTFTGLVIGISAATGTLTAIYLGRLGDRRGQRQILAACASVAGLLFIPQMLVGAGWQLLLLQALTGAAAGGIMPALAALLAHYTQPGEEGRVYGMENSLRAASRAVAPMAGAAIAAWFGVRLTFAATGLLFWLVAGLALYLLPPTRSAVNLVDHAG
jgi:DHA1 family multidrug resistance protein-like MFS transporter